MGNWSDEHKEEEQRKPRLVNKYVTTPTTKATKLTASPFKDTNSWAINIRETKPPERLRHMIADKATEDCTKIHCKV
eukprot:10023040-Ditylum_brightwellii.AAC.1